MQENQTATEVSNAFTRLLQDFRQGASLGELSEAMQNCVAAARETSKPAKIVYTITFTPQGDAIVVTDKVDEKIPAEDRKGGIFFADENNCLIRENPAQQRLPLREVERPPTPELKEPVKLQATAS